MELAVGLAVELAVGLAVGLVEAERCTYIFYVYLKFFFCKKICLY